MSHHVNETGRRQRHVVGVPICYPEGCRVVTKDGRSGTVLGFRWEKDLVIFQDGASTKGFYVVTVDFEGFTEEFLRHDLSGNSLSDGGFW